MTATAARERNRTLDVMKAFGILSIVLAHAIPPGPVVEVVQTYYLAVFFFASGYVFKPEFFTDLRALFRSRILPLYVIFTAWNLSYLFFETLVAAPVLARFGVDLGADHHITYVPRAAAAILTLTGDAYSMAGALWFIISLITANALFGLLGWIAQRLPSHGSSIFLPVAILAAFLVGFYSLAPIDWPSRLNTALVGLLVLYFGYRFRQVESRVPVVPLLAVLCFAVVLALRGSIDLTVNQYRDLGTFLVAVWAGIYALYFLSTRLQHVSLLAYIGRNTLFIAATHFLAFKLVALVHVSVKHLPLQELAVFPAIEDGWWWVAYFIVGVAAPLLLKATVLDHRAGAGRAERYDPRDWLFGTGSSGRWSASGSEPDPTRTPCRHAPDLHPPSSRRVPRN